MPFAVDFKIDIPPAPTLSQAEASTDARELSDELQNVIDAEKNGKANETVDFDADGPETIVPDRVPMQAAPTFPKRPGQAARKAPTSSQSTPKAGTAQVTASNGFPMMQCLAPNVKFWERVYSEVDEHQMLVHDRDDLSIIYAVVNVPAASSRSERTGAMRVWRQHFEQVLGSLATKADTPSRWNPEERKVARRIPSDKLNAAWLSNAPNTLRFQGGMKTRFEGGIARSLSYMPTIYPIINQHGLPADIVHLPHVESSYVPHARSKVGAVGLWQLMPGTMQLMMGKAYVHRRTEVGAATEGAARLLRQNYNATRSWPLALTAYNHGLGGVRRAMKRTGSRDLCEIIERYESPSFRFASSNFYAQFLAARNLALQRYESLANKRGTHKVLKEVLASHDKEGST